MTASPGCEVRNELAEDTVDDRDREHQPYGSRRRQLAARSSSDAAAVAPAGLGRLHGIRVQVEDDELVPGAQQTCRHVRAHPAETNHPELHDAPLAQA